MACTLSNRSRCRKEVPEKLRLLADDRHTLAFDKIAVIIFHSCTIYSAEIIKIKLRNLRD